MNKENLHPKGCSCCNNDSGIPDANNLSRKDFLKTVGAASVGLGLAPMTAFALQEEGKSAEINKNKTIKSGKAQLISLLHTTDIHGQINVHDEFFWENEKAVFKKRGGFTHLKTLINELRSKNSNTLLLDGGDCFQGSALAAFTEGQAMVPLMNDLRYDLVLPGNWEVVYGKKMLIKDLGAYNALKVCANMYHDESGESLFPPYQVFYLAGIKIGFIGYNDPLTPIRQAPDYSKGIKFTYPELNIAKYVRLLREQEQCSLVFVLSHMGLAQQLHLSNQPHAEGVDYILGADTHERIRKPLQGKYAKVTEPGAFASFIGKLDIVIEDGKIKDESYELIEVDPEKYPEDPSMKNLISDLRKPHEERMNKVLGHTKSTLMRYYVLETPMDNIITDAMIWKTNTDFSLSNGVRFCPPLVASEGIPQPITNEFLWSIMPIDPDMKTGEITGQQLWDWLEKELENVFSKDATKRFGGWLVRFQGMKIKFTIENEYGKRLVSVAIRNKPLELNKTYSFTACERDGDPDSVICRIKDVKHTHKTGFTLHQVVEEYLAAHSPIAPHLEGRAVATDAPSTLLTQVSDVNYQFR